MKTDDLVRVLAADARRIGSPRTTIASAALVSGAAACLAFVSLVGVRPDLLSALTDARVAFKFAFAMSAALAAAVYGLKTIRPDDRSSPKAFALLPLVLLTVAVALELSITPRGAWFAAAMGAAPFRCLALIVATALLPIAALLGAMSSGAPRSPALAGAAAGLSGGAIGAGVFALYCPNDSVLFVAIWYGLGLAITGALGAAVGARRLAW